MPKLSVKPLAQLSEADFVAHPVWAGYDDPDEMSLLEQLGFKASEVMCAFRSLQTPEEIVFPLPKEAASLPFRYLYLSSVVTIASGRQLVGYRTSACLGVFHHGTCYLFNKAIRDLSRQNAETLASKLGVKTIFPAQIYFPATSKIETFSL